MHRILTDSLVASRGIVFMPINEGQETEALNLLKEARDARNAVAAEFVAFRDARFGPISGLTLPTIDELTAPVPAVATTASAPDWLNDWERPQRTFEVLGQWSEMIPTDGVHVETHLSNTIVADEEARARLSRVEGGA
jgi:hypothetical protein